MNYEVDGLTPKRTVRPESIAALSKELATAHAAREAVVPWGGGTRMGIGNVPERYDVALDLTGLSQTVEHIAGDLTVITDAGITVAELQKTLAKAGQRLPFDVPEPDRATIGGSVASNAPGHTRSSLGGIRDWVIGMKVVLADGTITKTGGRVVKNVQGFDLHRLHTGAFGTLGVIAEIGFKLTPLPAQTRTVAIWFDSVEEAKDLVMRSFNGAMLPEGLTVFAGAPAKGAISTLTDASDSSILVLAHVTGVESSVTRQVNDLTGSAGTLDAAGYESIEGDAGQMLWRTADSSQSDSPTAGRANFKPSTAFDFANEALAIDGCSLEVQGGFGSVLVGVDSGDSAAGTSLRELAKKHGGNLTLERLPLDAKSEIDVFPDAGKSIAVMRSIKQRFDPNSNLNPGRFVGRI